jgi:hypothetical protein
MALGSTVRRLPIAICPREPRERLEGREPLPERMRET